MYFLSFNIAKQAAPIFRSANRFKSGSASLKSPFENFDQALGGFILMVEGFHHHVSNLKKDEAQTMLKHTQQVAKQFYQVKEDIRALEGIDSAGLNTKLKYAIKAIHRLEALLHRNSTKDMPVEKTPIHIKEGLTQYSQEAVAKSLNPE